MRISFVLDGSHIKMPDGVLTVTSEMLKNWNSKDELILLINYNHWAYEYLTKQFDKNSNVIVRRAPFILPSEVFNYVKHTILTKILYHCISLASSPIYIYLISKWIRENNLDCIVSQNGGWPGGELNRWFIIAAKLTNIKKIILVIHNLPSVRKFLYFFTIIRDSIIRLCCTKIVTVSESCKLALTTKTNIGCNICVIYNGININKSINHRSSYPWSNKMTVIGYVGSISKRKGVHILLKSINHVKKPCEIVLVGSGDPLYFDYLKNIIKTLKNPVHVLGFREDAKELIRGMDILVLPSIAFESFGVVILEAMQRKVPVICSDVGGMKEIVINNITGLVVENNSVIGLSKAINILLNDEQKRLLMGQNGYERLINRFTIEAMVENYKKVIK